MHTTLSLKHLAIAAAKSGDWDSAITHNTSLLEENPRDTQALNRLGVAYLHLKKTSKAKEAFATVIGMDKTNIIAKKHLDSIKHKRTLAAPSFAAQQFIEEPGITKIVVLHRLAGKQILESLAVGQPCSLKPKKRYISVEIDGQYIGSLPEDISFRLTKLINTGNTYHCAIHTTCASSCSVYLKELARSKRNRDFHSFPAPRTSLASQSEIDEFVLLEDSIPVEMLDHDRDFEKTLDDVQAPNSSNFSSSSED